MSMYKTIESVAQMAMIKEQVKKVQASDLPIMEKNKELKKLLKAAKKIRDAK